MKFFILTLTVALSSCLFGNSQEYKRGNFWSVGYDPVVTFNFNGNLSIAPVQNVNCGIGSSSSSICDTNGNLVLFSNGFIIYNDLGDAVDNGYYVNCPNGNVLCNYYGGSSLFNQTSIILPKKGNTYYVFSTGMSDSTANNYLNHILTEFDVLNYSVVDMDSNSGKGKVVQKNVVLADNRHYVNCAMHAVKHANGKDWWLVKADCANNRFEEFIVREDTILGPYYQNTSNVGDFCYWFGQIYFNNSGTQMASGIYGNLLNGNFYYRNGVDIYDFDRCDGTISFVKNYRVPEDTTSYPNWDTKMGLAFSANDSLLYMSNIYTVYQIDLTDTNTYNATFIHGPDTTIANFPWYDMMGLAPDGKIYIGNGNGTRKYMSYIDKPNVKGLGCDFIANGVWQPYTNLMSPPNMPNYGLGPDSALLIGCWPVQSGSVNVEREELNVYPNPAHNKLYFKTTSKELRELYNALGVRLLFTKQDEMDVSSLSSGVYYVKVGNEVRKVVIE